MRKYAIYFVHIHQMNQSFLLITHLYLCLYLVFERKDDLFSLPGELFLWFMLYSKPLQPK